MDPRMIPKGSGPEYNYGEHEGKVLPNQPGVYYHPGAEKFIETFGVQRPDGSVAYAQDSGKIQADAFKQIGYRAATQEEEASYRADLAAKAEAQRKAKASTTTVMSSSNERK